MGNFTWDFTQVVMKPFGYNAGFNSLYLFFNFHREVNNNNKKKHVNWDKRKS